MDVLFVKPDYFGTTPKACMDGWARRFLQIVPDGRVVPCHAATSITSLVFDDVRDGRSRRSGRVAGAPRLSRRGVDGGAVRSCDKRAIDFGGCRCQAFALTGDAAATDPACRLSVNRAAIDAAQAGAEADAGTGTRRYLYRGPTTRAAR